MICFLAGFAAGIFTAGLAVYFTRKKPADDKIGAVGESGDFRRPAVCKSDVLQYRREGGERT